MVFLASARRTRMEQTISEVWGILSTSEGETLIGSLKRRYELREVDID
jgi:hypothetical protein